MAIQIFFFFLVGSAFGASLISLFWARKISHCHAKTATALANDLQKSDHILSIENQLQQSRAVLEQMVEGVVVLDTSDNLLLANKAAKQLLSISDRQGRHPNIREVVRHLELFKLIDQVRRTQTPIEHTLTFYLPQTLVLHTNARQISNQHGVWEPILLVFHDMTHLTELERMKSEFVANASHELKTPVTAIQGFAEALQTDTLDTETKHRFLAIIFRHAERLGSLIDHLLLLSRLEQGPDKISDEFEQKNLVEVIQTALQLCQSKAIEKTITLSLTSMNEALVSMDSALMEQAIVNLVENAIKYSPPCALVSIGVQCLEDHVSLTVTDVGQGISENHLPHIFERFYRVDKSRSRNQGGTGLGLSIVKHIIQLHHGSISVESTLGKGSAFRIVLPLVPLPYERRLVDV